MIFYCHDTAIAYWRRCALLAASLDAGLPRPKLAKGQDGTNAQPCITDGLAKCAKSPREFRFATAREIREACPVDYSDDSPIHVAAGNDRPSKATKDISYHRSITKLPKGAYCSIGRGRAVASPSLAFVQKCATLSFREAVALGYDLCSSFAIVDSTINLMGFTKTEPLSSAVAMGSLVASMKAAPGAKLARRAVRYVVDGAASPRERALAILLTMPTKEGGYGLPLPELNARIEVAAADRRGLGKQYLVADMLWRQAKVAVEYDSDQWHSGAEKIGDDSKRRNLLKAMGYEVISVTNAEITNLFALDTAVTGICRALGIRKRVAVAQYGAKKRSLHDWLIRQ